MGREKYLKKIKKLFEQSSVIDYKSITRIIKQQKEIKQYTKQLIRNLIKKGTIKKLTKGYYTIYDDSSLAVFCFKPAYLGLQDALSFHNLWEQETIPIIITTRKIRQGIRNVLGMNIMLRRIDKKYFFGFDYYPQGSFYLPYSDKEKTFIDMIYFKESLSKDILKNLVKTLDKNKIKSYLKIYPLSTKKRVLKFFKCS